MRNLLSKITLGASASLILASAANASISTINEEVFITSSDRATIEKIESHPELIIDHMTKDGFELYGPKGLKEWLKNADIDFRAESAHSHSHKALSAADKYPTHKDITKKLKALAAKYPEILKLESIGKSVQGRDLWVMKISDNVNVDEVEPEFKYISSMHGDEIVGRPLTQFLIKDLAEGYGKDKRITDLINNTELYIMPSMNPDGSTVDRRGRARRANANGRDLNRNFPDWTTREINSIARREVETKAVMKFQAERQFSLSANFHGGAVVVNYPWDSSKVRHPLDKLLINLSLRYAKENAPMTRSNEFSRGITNGADWYVVRGGMQDWSYVFHNDLQVTVELSNTKYPRYSQIPSFYKDNKESMMVYMEAVHQGAGFKINNSKVDGTVEIKRMLTDGEMTKLGSFGFKGGEFYKVLSEGEYWFTVTYGNTTKTFSAKVAKDEILANGNFITL